MQGGHLAALGFPQSKICHNFVGRQDPIHWYRMATLRRTAEPQRPIPTSSAHDLDLLAGDNLAANQTITFLIQGAPWPELIEPSQRFQFVSIR
jgi:hypothetical protein